MNAPLAAIIRGVMRGVDFHALYPAKIVSQNADGTLELIAEVAHLKLPSRIPIRLGIPGASVKVAAGGRVLVGFENGDEHAPVALLWDTTTVTQLNLNGSTIRLNGGGIPVAKEGSLTVAHTHQGQAGPWPVTLIPAQPAIAVGQGSQSVKVP